MKKALSPLGAFAFLAVFSLTASAQTAQLTGTVSDNSGALFRERRNSHQYRHWRRSFERYE